MGGDNNGVEVIGTDYNKELVDTLNAGKTTLYNVPNIQDTQMMFKILETLGAKVEKKNGKIWKNLLTNSLRGGNISKLSRVKAVCTL